MSSDSAPFLKGHWLWGNLKDFNRDSLSFIESAARQGDLLRIHFGPMHGYFVNHPRLPLQGLGGAQQALPQAGRGQAR